MDRRQKKRKDKKGGEIKYIMDNNIKKICFYFFIKSF